MKTVSNTPKHPLLVLENFHRARASRARGEVATDAHGKPIRIGIVHLGGVMSAALGASVSNTISQAGLGDVAVVHIGLSAGAITGAASVLGLSHMVVPEYERLADERFVSLFRFRNPLDFCNLLETLERIFGNETFDHVAPGVYAVATNISSRKAKLLDIKQDKLAAVFASMAIPGCQLPVRIGEDLYIDGGWCPLPMKDIILGFRLTDVLIIANRPTANEEKYAELILDWYTGADTSLDTALVRMQSLKRTRVLAVMPTLATAIPRLMADSTTIRKNSAIASRFMEGILNDAHVA